MIKYEVLDDNWGEEEDVEEEAIEKTQRPPTTPGGRLLWEVIQNYKDDWLIYGGRHPHPLHQEHPSISKEKKEDAMEDHKRIDTIYEDQRSPDSTNTLAGCREVSPEESNEEDTLAGRGGSGSGYQGIPLHHS